MTEAEKQTKLQRKAQINAELADIARKQKELSDKAEKLEALLEKLGTTI